MNESPFKNFIDFLRYQRRFSGHTIISYQTDLNQFLNFLNENYEGILPAGAGYQVIRSFIASQLDHGTSPRSVNRKITCLRTYFRFLLRAGEVKINPMLRVVAPKSGKKLPVFVEESRMNSLLDGNKTEIPGDEFESSLVKLLIEMFYGTGIRLAELIELEEKNVDMEKRTIKVLGKRNKERIIPLNNELVNCISEFRQMKKNQIAENSSKPVDFLFQKKDGTKLNRKFVYRKVKYYLSLVTTIDKKSPHVLRHTFATHMLNKGADLNAIKELLGHANLSATQVYTHNTVEKLKTVYHKAHPRS